jgi:hypothetical protein
VQIYIKKQPMEKYLLLDLITGQVQTQVSITYHHGIILIALKLGKSTCLVLGFQILITYLDGLIIIQIG